MAGIGALQPMGSDRGLGRSCPIPVVAQHRLNGAVGWKSAIGSGALRRPFARPQVSLPDTAFSDARPGVKSGNMHRSAPLSSLFKPEQSLTGVPRLFVALELCSHAGTK